MAYILNNYNDNGNQIANSFDENSNNNAEFEIFLKKKEDNLTFFDKHIEERPLVIMFEEENDFNYKVGNCSNVAIETSSESSINTSNQTNIVVAAAKVSKKRDKPPKVVSFNNKNVITAALKAKQGRLKSSTTNVPSLRCTKKYKHKRLFKAEILCKA